MRGHLRFSVRTASIFLIGIVLTPLLHAATCPTTVTESMLSTERLKVLRTYRNQGKRHSLLLDVFPEDQVLALLADEELPRYALNFEKMLEAFSSGRLNDFAGRLKAALKKVLKDQVPESTLDSRLLALFNHRKGAVLRALGDNTLEEIQLLFHGGKPLRPTSDSLLGRYLAETGAAKYALQFPIHQTRRWGPERLVVAVSARSFPKFVKYFQREEFVTIVGHALLAHNHRVKGIRFDDLRLPHLHSVLPYVLLKTTEAQRLTQYFQLFEKFGGGWGHVAAQPWLLPGYCAQGGYQCCTHWIGNMPIGDKLVPSYSFPGRAEQNEAPHTRKLRAYDHEDPLVHRVWKVPGHEQFADVLGQRAANLRGEFASTGWVYETLMGPTSVDRVPVVFWVTEDHTQAFDEDFPMQHEAAF